MQNLSHSFSDTDPTGRFAEIHAFAAAEALWEDHEAESSFASARRTAAELGVELRLPRHEEPPTPREPGTPGCDWPWRSGYVTHDGQVQPCCMVMGVERAVLGRLGQRTFPELWHGDAAIEDWCCARTCAGRPLTADPAPLGRRSRHPSRRS